MDLTSGALWGAFGAIVVANILLSGDNAVVIAMAARSLPRKQQWKAIFWGSAAHIFGVEDRPGRGLRRWARSVAH